MKDKSESAFTTSPVPSKRVPSSSSVCIDVRTESKYGTPSGFFASAPTSCAKAIPKTYVMMANKQSVKSTDRVAAIMPLMRMSNSGMARKRRAMRAMRERRNKRAIRKIDASPKPPPLPPPEDKTTALISHVSTTIISTNAESNTNHPSFIVFFFSRKAFQRTDHSKEKNTQKKCSAIWKLGSASISTEELFRSVSTHIHKALKAMTAKVAFSKCGWRAMNCHMPRRR
mmetsp:Transcript_68545/g.192120  ORF Transcript_68545/g.192120 Transcript_68545/m.192120 type:complete len:228 (+) Transcript_68545:715-1398(+)